MGAFPIVYLLIKERIKKKKWQLTLQFKDGVVSLSNALAAGYSIENAFHEAVIDLRLLYDENSGIIKEFQKIEQQIRLNRNVEELLMKFGMQAGIEDIKDFAEIVMTAKRTGGDLIKIMKTTSNSIGEKIEVQREIQTLIAAKRFEGNIMTVIPLGIILYLKLCMPGFLRPLYEGVAGRGIMSIALTGYVLSLLLLRKIIDIKV
ncbi:tight adherence protein B [[Clostridium] polysaccharolyticum]|uniref:Tight adherence protein B n=1 Tax=[Clostridium] polysaccharolyticum TaxID=29364 RepID=A0A1I0D920_9FIRM|nr:tight adherence protein B [[Clostridium] polysaccharolyticum]